MTCQNHQHCIDDAFAKAQELCEAAGVRLTSLRKQILSLIWQNHQPVGAYDLIEQLAENSQRKVAPPTVYRSLDFLLEMGLIHRINSLNAFIGCPNPTVNSEQQHQCYFFICKTCRTATEYQEPAVFEAIQSVAAQQSFAIEDACMELIGVCKTCVGAEAINEKNK